LTPIQVTIASGPITYSSKPLAPAPSGPVEPACEEAVQVTLNGNLVPLLCPTGAVNALAWKGYATFHSRLMSLGQNATPCEVYEDMNNPGRWVNATTPEIYSIYTLASTYYGWQFTVPSPADPDQPPWISLCKR
jgi:hypothetical protein